MRLLFVVHRYAPYPGGSEIYVQGMAEESLRRGHTVTVFAGEHQGNYNGVTVTDDPNILLQKWDLIVVHGGDVNVQNFVLTNARNIPNPILYLLVLPSHSDVCIQALHNCALLGCSTVADFKHCEMHQVQNKAVRIRHGITWQNCMGKAGFKQQHGITQRMFVSCGGYWKNKAMKELAGLFEVAELTNSVLVTTGYDNRSNLMPAASDRVIPLLLDDRDAVLSAIHDADCLLMHSYQEGFGLVLLEAMLNQTPWIARKIAGAEQMQDYGWTYQSDAELLMLLKRFDRNQFDIQRNYEYVVNNHMIWNTVDDIESAVKALI